MEGYRRWLVSRLGWREDRVYVVLGHPGAVPVAAADVAAFWGLLPEGVRGLVRFVPYGPVAGSGAVGQVLAGWLGLPVAVVAGLPVGGAGAGAGVGVRTVRGDGALGWEPFVAEVLYCPAGADGVVPEPAVLAWRSPVAGLAEAGPGVFACGPGMVAEVVQSGVWLRPAGPAPGPAVARTHVAAADEPLVFLDEALDNAEWEPAVTGVLNALDPAVRASFRLVQVPSLAAGQSAGQPATVPPVAVPPPTGPPVAEAAVPQPAAAPAAGGAHVGQDSEAELDALVALASAVHRASGAAVAGDEAGTAAAAAAPPRPCRPPLDRPRRPPHYSARIQHSGPARRHGPGSAGKPQALQPAATPAATPSAGIGGSACWGARYRWRQ